MFSDVTFRAGPSELQRAGCENNIGQTWFKCMTNSLQLRKDTLTIRWLPSGLVQGEHKFTDVYLFYLTYLIKLYL